MMKYSFSEEELLEMAMKASARMGVEREQREGYEEAWKEAWKEGWEEGWEEGFKEGQRQMKAMIKELNHILVPVGRVGDFLAAIEDDAKFFALAEEFGLASKYGLLS